MSRVAAQAKGTERRRRVGLRTERRERSDSGGCDRRAFGLDIEISRQVGESARIAAQAVEQVAKAKSRSPSLPTRPTASAVVGLISTIAAQTNLLALNATIEAARAGEAGRDLPSLPPRVKSLATQTARATEGITAQVSAIQGSTQEAVDTIKGIGQIIDKMSEIATTVASAVEEQGAATAEIAATSSRRLRHAERLQQYRRRLQRSQ